MIIFRFFTLQMPLFPHSMLKNKSKNAILGISLAALYNSSVTHSTVCHYSAISPRFTTLSFERVATDFSSNSLVRNLSGVGRNQSWFMQAGCATRFDCPASTLQTHVKDDNKHFHSAARLFRLAVSAALNKRLIARRYDRLSRMNREELTKRGMNFPSEIYIHLGAL